MKRSKINQIIKNMEALAATHCFALPGFCSWTPEDWTDKGSEYDEIRDNMLGWDITDYGQGNFDKIGLALITIRNGNQKNPKYKKPYAEKLLMLSPGQHAPLHFHWSKMEDIINRGGNHVILTVYNGAEDGRLLDTDVTVDIDGRKRVVPAGTKITLLPGESMTMVPYLYHSFEVPSEGGPVLLGEVSMCNDDEIDNCFYEKVGRFPAIEEDEKPYRLLCNEYPHAE